LYKAPRGTSDILTEDQVYWQYILQKADLITRLYGYKRIDTPVFEETGLFTRGVGEETDIVQKEMYTFEDRGGNSMTLRPEGTAPICRAYLEHGMQNLSQPVKLFSIPSCFRYERPQAGRYRQFHQIGCEAVGESDPALDAEVIDMAWQFFTSLGLKGLHLIVNSIGCRICRPGYLTKLNEYYSRHIDKLCQDCRNRLEINTLRLLDCKVETCQEIALLAPKSFDNLCPECADHFERLKRYLTILGLPFEINPCLVRGLDYYTKTVFEIQPESEGSQSTIGGGGRYDNLIEELGGKPTPALGFATGVERIVTNLKKQNIAVSPLPSPVVFIAFLGDAAKESATKLAGDLRKKGISVIQAFENKSLKAQLRQANTLAVHYTIIMGEDEIKTGTVQLRDMTTSGQKSLSLTGLYSALKE
jgi:histidyl-tRNA synthetase